MTLLIGFWSNNGGQSDQTFDDKKKISALNISVLDSLREDTLEGNLSKVQNRTK